MRWCVCRLLALPARRFTVCAAPSSPLSAPTQACGSGGTTAGIALGNHLGGLGLRVHAYGVCDDPPYFYRFCDGLLEGMGATPDVVGADSEGMFRCACGGEAPVAAGAVA